jgi:hypothetical protein
MSETHCDHEIHIFKTVKDMVGAEFRDDLNDNLVAFLRNVNEKCEKFSGGGLTSRQTIALAVQTWIVLNPGKSPFTKNER